MGLGHLGLGGLDLLGARAGLRRLQPRVGLAQLRLGGIGLGLGAVGGGLELLRVAAHRLRLVERALGVGQVGARDRQVLLGRAITQLGQRCVGRLRLAVGDLNAGDLALFMLGELKKNEFTQHRVGISN